MSNLSEETLDEITSYHKANLAVHVERLFGKPCPEFDENCFTCQAWLKFDSLFGMMFLKEQNNG